MVVAVIGISELVEDSDIGGGVRSGVKGGGDAGSGSSSSSSFFHPLEESHPRDLVLCAREEMWILLLHLIFSFPVVCCTISGPFMDDRQYLCPVEFRKLSEVTARN
ncbi:hypothetical protein Tco_0766750 [Tanacetum coccineum]